MTVHLLRDLAAAFAPQGDDPPADRLTRLAEVLTRYAITTGDREASHYARMLATDLHQTAAEVEP